MFILPIDAKPNQHFRCVIPVDGRNLALLISLAFNTEAGHWVLSLADDVSGAVLIDSLPLISGVFPSANLLDQYNFLRIGSLVLVRTDPDDEAVVPDSTNLGIAFQLVWGDTYERI